MSYETHGHVGRPNTLKVSYKCGGKTFMEYICLEHRGFAKNQADHWWKYRGGGKVESVKEALAFTDYLLQPSKIRVQKKGKYYNISEASF